jgi:hypothetical protein
MAILYGDIDKDTKREKIHYNRGDVVSSQTVNDIQDTAIDAHNMATEALDKADSVFQGNGTVVSVGGREVGTLAFSSDPQQQLNDLANKSELPTNYVTYEETEVGGSEINPEYVTKIEFMSLMKSSLLESLYPIGSIYISTNLTDPTTLIGGTWKRLTDDAYLKIATGSETADTYGGNPDNTIRINNMPSHSHALNAGGGVLGVYTNTVDTTSGFAGGGLWADINKATTSIANTGGEEPYYPYNYRVYVWKRTA